MTNFSLSGRILAFFLPSLVLMLMAGNPVHAQTQAAEKASLDNQSDNTQKALTAQTKPSGLHWVDWVLIVIYASSTIGLALYFSRRQKSTSEYFTGSEKMNPC